MGKTNFRDIRNSPGLAYFDKTSYIAAIAEAAPDVQLLCRPRRFGKSLTISMLQSFHGVEFRNRYDELFKDLDVHRAVKDGKIVPGQYLVMKFDFSAISRPPKIDLAAGRLEIGINMMMDRFKETYNRYLHDSPAWRKIPQRQTDDPVRNLYVLVTAINSALRHIYEAGNKNDPLFGVKGIYLLADEYDAYANLYMNPHDLGAWANTELESVLKGFWSAVKGNKDLDYGIKKVYLTGVTPLLSSLTSSFNEQENLTFSPDFSTICGLTRADVLGALQAICTNKKEVEERLGELEFYANGYHFCDQRGVETVFNTQTALSYLQAVRLREKPEAEDPPNSEVSEPFLQICATAPAAVNVMQLALQRDEHECYRKIPYKEVLYGFNLTELGTLASGNGDVSAWRSLMVYMGGLTFDSHDPSKSLKITNRAAAKRFGYALLDLTGLYASGQSALYSLLKNGNIKPVLNAYIRLVRERDCGNLGFSKTETDHHDSIWFTILENPAIKPNAEYEVRKWSNNRMGRVDLLVTNEKELYTVVEFKNIPLNTLDIEGRIIDDKAKLLEGMILKDILQLRFDGNKRGSGTIQDWFDGDDQKKNYGEVRKQLQDYITGSTVQKEIAEVAGKKNFRAFAAVIVGARQILMREMGADGKWIDEFQLA